jgi:RNA polymerase sigma-70 factor (ECF subfamily)
MESDAFARGQRDAMFSAVYAELRPLARRQMAREKTQHTLQPTVLLHETYLKLIRQKSLQWNGHRHFIAIAVQAMRQVLVDHARRKGAEKRPNQRVTVTLSGIPQNSPASQTDLIALTDAMEKLAEKTPQGTRHVQLVELVWLGGMPVAEAAEAVGVSRRQATRDLRWAQAFLERELRA